MTYRQHRRTRTGPAALMVGLPLMLVACGGPGEPGPSAAVPSVPAMPPPSASASPAASSDVRVLLCGRLEEVGVQLDALRAVELRALNRVTLDIALSRLQVAYDELDQVELDALEEDLEEPLRRLGYRLDEVALAVEDFRTNTRPQRAAPHVEEDSGAFAADLAELIVLTDC